MHHGNIFTAVFSPDGTKILTGSSDYTARLWDAKTGQETGPILRHGFWVWSAAFNGDATRVVTASSDHTARVWDAASGRAITPPLRHGDAVYRAMFSPDGRMVATGSADGTARLWEAENGAALSMPLSVQGEVTRMDFRPGGATLMVASKDPLVRFWDLPPSGTPPAWLADLAEFAATQVTYDALRVPQLSGIEALRDKLLASRSDDPWERFGRWYFLETEARPISPWSTVRLKEYVDGLMAAGDRDSLDYAITLSQKMSASLDKLTKLRGQARHPARCIAGQGRGLTGGNFLNSGSD